MVETSSGAGRTELRQEARRRSRRRMLVSLLVVVPLSALVIILAGLLGSPDAALVNWMMIGAGGALVAAGLLAAAWMVHQRHVDPPLVTGADSATRRAVRQALRDGQTDNPRVDLLARDLIEHTPRHAWVPYLLGGLALLSLVRLLLGDWEAEDIVPGVVTIPIYVVLAVAYQRHHRRLRGYRGLRREGPSSAERDPS
ncbi:hypothetical protein ACI2K4_15925 [Micromonospora sp. NPDC050397]|uniref:hypothetical protein n=1 Tax=Micromonospora sp. NPDC050397 TaxID=3364279 RepID=UPI00384CAB42